MERILKQKIILIMAVTVVLSVVLFLFEYVLRDSEQVVDRNTYGKGEKVAEYELRIDGEKEKQPIQFEVEEQEYSQEEIQNIFREVSEKLDKVILGENKSFDRVEKDLNLVTELEGYPVTIHWQLDSYSVLNLYGEIQEKNLVEEGTLVELRGAITYREQEFIYIQYARVFPLTRQGIDKLLYDIETEVSRLEEESRGNANFELPQEVDGKKLEWHLKKTGSWYYVLIMGITLCVYLVYRRNETTRRRNKHRKEELLRDYPSMISKFTMLLSTGTTVKQAWEKIVQNYEAHRERLGVHAVYEEMGATLREIQSGLSEAEAYERFGKRCAITVYLKFGTLLSQNLRKGSKGISEILRMEAIQSFENRKNTARRIGEEMGTKLLMPMLGMLAVVFIIVIVPAFLTMQL